MAEERATPRRALATGLGGLVAVAALVAGALFLLRDRWERSGPPIAVDGWAPYWQTLDAYASFDANAELFREVSVVAYSALGADQIVPYERLAADAVPRFDERTTGAGIALLATIFDDSAGVGTMAAILADPEQRAVHVDTIVRLVVDNGFDGVDLDYEQFAFVDPRDTWETTRVAWIVFLEELAASLHGQGKRLVVSVPGPDYTVYDHAAMGEIVDRIRVMTYDYSTSEPGPIAPAEWVGEVVDELTEMVPPEKLNLGIPMYGRDWPVAVDGTCPADQQPTTRTMSMVAALELAAQRGITPTFDEETQESRFDYVEQLTGCSVERTVHFLDARGVHRRAWIAHRNDLHGVALWALGDESPSIWAAIELARDGEEDWPEAET